jgi:hypothetical protein
MNWDVDMHRNNFDPTSRFLSGSTCQVNTVFWERCAVRSEIECQIFGVGKRFDLGKVTFTSISSPRCSFCIFDSNSCLQQANNAKPRRLEVHQSRPCVEVQTLVRGDSRHRRLITSPQILKPAQENPRESLHFLNIIASVVLDLQWTDLCSL